MSQQEFDTYLSLLCRLLRIPPQQREQVAEEFRTHMEDRLEDLLASGMERDEAVKVALEEFGDAAGLAAQLVSIVQGRRKRWIMRIGTVSVVGLAAAVLLGVALWPEGANVKAPQAVAQTEEKSEIPDGRPPDKEAKTEFSAEQSIEEKLVQRIDADYPEVPFKEVLEDLHERTHIQIYINHKALEAAAVDLETPISINLKSVRVDTALDLILEQAGEGNLAYVERDGILIISTADALSGASEVRVYNCRDLLAMASPVPRAEMLRGPVMGMPPGGSGFLGMPGMVGGERALRTDSGVELPPGGFLPEGGPGPQPGGSAPKAPSVPKGTSPTGGGSSSPKIPKGIQPQFGGGGGGGVIGGGGGAGMAGGGAGGGGMGGVMGGGGGRPVDRPYTEEEMRASRLINLITTAVKPDSWQDMGGFGTISEYQGLIVINHNARTHKEVENVLKMLREAAGLPMNGTVDGIMMPMPGPMPGGVPIPSAAPRR